MPPDPDCQRKCGQGSSRQDGERHMPGAKPSGPHSMPGKTPIKPRRRVKPASIRRPRDVDAKFRRAIQLRLLRWYDSHKRDLPWRRRQDDAYAQLLAEYLLQQTQVATVLNYYERLIRRFPTVSALAAASLDEVLALWSGLGYYRRARNLHAAARRIVFDYAGRIPNTVEMLMTLPGIGRYTAGAIASVAFGVRAPVVDGNVTRVLTRLLAEEGDAKSPTPKSRVWDMAEALLPENRCGDFNQAMMELGAIMCSPRAPACFACPLRSHCRALAKGLTERIPVTPRKTSIKTLSIVVAAVRSGDAILLVRRPEEGLWAGLWELPSEPVAEGESLGWARDRLVKRLGLTRRLNRTSDAPIRRQLTHRQVTFHVYHGRVKGKPRLNGRLGAPCRWVGPRGRAKLGISRAHQVIIESVGRVSSVDHGD